jgi:hypothetical protein
VEAALTQKKADWIKVNQNALLYFGGVPQAIVPDYVQRNIIVFDNFRNTVKMLESVFVTADKSYKILFQDDFLIAIQARWALGQRQVVHFELLKFDCLDQDLMLICVILLEVFAFAAVTIHENIW